MKPLGGRSLDLKSRWQGGRLESFSIIPSLSAEFYPREAGAFLSKERQWSLSCADFTSSDGLRHSISIEGEQNAGYPVMD